MILILLFTQLNNGYLTVRADRDSLPVYVDNDYIGLTPVIKYSLKPDEYSVGFFPQDSIENASWRLKSGSLGALWKVARFGEGMIQVRVAPDSLTEVELSYRRVTQAPGRAQCMVGGVMAGIFTLGVLLTLAVQKIFF
jgi:hypothetical protein